MLTVVSSPDGAGTFQFSPVAANNIYEENDSVTITAVPSAGYEFHHWEGDLSGEENPAMTVMNGEKSVTAVFTSLPRCDLAINITTPDSGTVTLSPPQPPSGYFVGDNIYLNATPASGYVFSHWEGSLTGNANPQSLVMSDNLSVTAVFNPGIAVVCDPTIGGTVTLEPGQASSGYVPGTEVTLSAAAAEGYAFMGWSGDVSGTDNPVTIAVDGPKTITAEFVSLSRFPWRWMMIGVLGFFVLALLIYFVRVEMSRS